MEVPVFVEQILYKTSNAREIHRLLATKENYTDWIARVIARYKLQEGVDFIKSLGTVRVDGKMTTTETDDYVLSEDTWQGIIENHVELM